MRELQEAYLSLVPGRPSGRKACAWKWHVVAGATYADGTILQGALYYLQ